MHWWLYLISCKNTHACPKEMVNTSSLGGNYILFQCKITLFSSNRPSLTCNRLWLQYFYLTREKIFSMRTNQCYLRVWGLLHTCQPPCVFHCSLPVSSRCHISLKFLQIYGKFYSVFVYYTVNDLSPWTHGQLYRFTKWRLFTCTWRRREQLVAIFGPHALASMKSTTWSCTQLLKASKDSR